MIRVLHSELENNIGGIETFLINLSKCICSSEIHFDFLMRGSNSYIEKKILSTGATIYKVPRNIISYYVFIRKLLLNNNYDYVHIHKNSAANIILPLIVKKYSKAKLIIHSHNTKPSNESKVVLLLHYLNRDMLIKMSDYRFACSDKAAIWMFGKNYKKLNVDIIKNGILAKDYDFNPSVRKLVRRKLHLNGYFVIGNVGAFRKQKNHKFLVKLFSEIKIPNKKLVLIGVGPLENRIKKQVKEMNLEKKVIFLNQRTDVNKILQAMDLFVMPSLWEGLSVSAIEAQASGLPLLLSNNVSKLTKITNNVRFLPLDNIELWISASKDIEKNFYRKSVMDQIVSNGYDIAHSANILADFYKN